MKKFLEDYLYDLMHAFHITKPSICIDALLILLDTMDNDNIAKFKSNNFFKSIKDNVSALQSAGLLIIYESEKKIYMDSRFFGSGQWDKITSIELKSKKTYPSVPFQNYIYAEFTYE